MSEGQRLAGTKIGRQPAASWTAPRGRLPDECDARSIVAREANGSSGPMHVPHQSGRNAYDLSGQSADCKFAASWYSARLDKALGVQVR